MAERFRVCFVCLGNICRSPAAEIVFRWHIGNAGLAGLVDVRSAGTSNWHVGDAMDPRARTALIEAGYSRSEVLAHRARSFTSLSFRDFDLVLGMDRSNEQELLALAADERAEGKVRLLRSFEPGPPEGEDLDVLDPYYGIPSDFAEMVEVVERACGGLLEEITRLLAS